jgi:hypothetical protein
MLRHVLNFVLAIACVLMLCSCWVETVNPLSDPQKPQSDPKLAGAWKNENGVMRFSARKDGWMDVAYEAQDSQNKPYVERYVLFTTAIGDNTYVNMKSASQKNYLILSYKITGNELSTSLMCDEEFKKASEAGTMKSQKTGSQYEADTVVTDSSEKLAAFVKQGEQAKLFPEPQKFKRLNDK